MGLEYSGVFAGTGCYIYVVIHYLRIGTEKRMVNLSTPEKRKQRGYCLIPWFDLVSHLSVACCSGSVHVTREDINWRDDGPATKPLPCELNSHSDIKGKLYCIAKLLDVGMCNQHAC